MRWMEGEQEVEATTGKMRMKVGGCRRKERHSQNKLMCHTASENDYANDYDSDYDAKHQGKNHAGGHAIDPYAGKSPGTLQIPCCI